MPDGCYCQGEGNCAYSWLDELLCEYVDGTMDPAVREAFEEVLDNDPVLAQQAERLRRTRTLLCQHGCQIQAPHGLQARVRQRLACEMMRPQQPFWVDAVIRLGRMTMWASAMGVVLMVGILVGATLFDEELPVDSEAPAAATHVAQQEVKPQRLPRAAMTPLFGQQPPRRLPLFVRHSASALHRPVQARYLVPEVLGPQHAGLQRTGGAP